MRSGTPLLLVLTLFTACAPARRDDAAPERVYAPTDTIIVFHEQGRTIFNTSMTADGSEHYFTDSNPDSREDGSPTAIWVRTANDARALDIPGIAIPADVHVTPDGQTLYLTEYGAAQSYIASMARTAEGWSEPDRRSELDRAEGTGYVTSTEDGVLCFSSGGDIYLYADGDLERLPDAINSPEGEYDPFIAQDGSFVIFVRQQPEIGDSNMFISFRIADGWTVAERLPTPFNGPFVDGSPYVTPDRQYLFFNSNRDDRDGLKTYQAPFYDWWASRAEAVQ